MNDGFKNAIDGWNKGYGVDKKNTDISPQARIEELEAQLDGPPAKAVSDTIDYWRSCAETYRAAIFVAYQMGLDAGAIHIRDGKRHWWCGRLEGYQGIRALTLPADLVEQATQKVIDDHADDR